MPSNWNRIDINWDLIVHLEWHVSYDGYIALCCRLDYYGEMLHIDVIIYMDLLTSYTYIYTYHIYILCSYDIYIIIYMYHKHAIYICILCTYHWIYHKCMQSYNYIDIHMCIIYVCTCYTFDLYVCVYVYIYIHNHIYIYIIIYIYITVCHDASISPIFFTTKPVGNLPLQGTFRHLPPIAAPHVRH